MLGVVVFAGDEGVEAAGQPVYRGVEGRVILVGKDDVEVAVELGGSGLTEAPADEREADQIALRALERRTAAGLWLATTYGGEGLRCPRT